MNHLLDFMMAGMLAGLACMAGAIALDPVPLPRPKPAPPVHQCVQTAENVCIAIQPVVVARPQAPDKKTAEDVKDVKAQLEQLKAKADRLELKLNSKGAGQ